MTVVPIRRFPQPRLVTFDAFGTLYTPKKSVAHQYADYAMKYHNIKLDPVSISKRFGNAYKSIEKQYPSYGQYSSGTVSLKEWWSLVIRMAVEPVVLPEEAVSGLYEYFNTRHPYTIFPDARKLMESLHKRKINMGVLSNSDSRLYDVLNSMGLLQLLPDRSHVCLSYHSGYDKPHVGAFRAAQRFMLPSDKDDPKDCWHIGDDYVRDGDGAIDAGWNCIIIDRNATEPMVIKGDKQPFRIIVNSLENIDAMFM